METSVLKRFFGYVEIKTKAASLLPFVLALLYALRRYQSFKPVYTAIFFAAMLTFDMFVTALNNYIDARSEGCALPFSKRVSKRVLIILFALAMVVSLILAYHEGLVFLACGGLCFLIGIFYTFGPAPISRMPLGEVFSGVFMGFFIPFLTVYINAPARSLVWYELDAPVLQVGLNVKNLLDLAVLSAPAMLCIANIMLANNICDVEKDVRVGRYTLPYYLGGKKALRLFALLYYAAYAAVAASAVFGILPLYALVAAAGLPAVIKNIRTFRARPSKRETFPLSVRNFLIVMLPLVLVSAAALAL